MKQFAIIVILMATATLGLGSGIAVIFNTLALAGVVHAETSLGILVQFIVIFLICIGAHILALVWARSGSQGTEEK